MDKPGVEDYPGDVDGDESPDWFLWKTNCPAVITEPYFLDNAHERDLFTNNPKFYGSFAEQLVVGIDNYFNGY